MGDMAEAIINGDFDEQTGDWLGEGQGFPRTREKGYYNSFNDKMFQEADGTVRPLDWDKKKFALGTRAIRKELAILIHQSKITEPDENVLVDRCRSFINKKYGKGWREQY